MPATIYKQVFKNIHQGLLNLTDFSCIKTVYKDLQKIQPNVSGTFDHVIGDVYFSTQRQSFCYRYLMDCFDGQIDRAAIERDKLLLEILTLHPDKEIDRYLGFYYDITALQQEKQPLRLTHYSYEKGHLTTLYPEGRKTEIMLKPEFTAADVRNYARAEQGLPPIPKTTAELLKLPKAL